MIYEPREDTYLLKNYVEGLDLQGKKVLEIGTGSGIIAEAMKDKGADVTASDINSEALEGLPKGIERVKSDLFENISGSFDLVVFNPPYLPGNEEEGSMNGSETWHGGEKGVEVTRQYLEQCSEHLNSNGEALVILSSLASIEELIENYGLELVGEESLWFEKLYVAKYCLE